MRLAKPVCSTEAKSQLPERTPQADAEESLKAAYCEFNAKLCNYRGASLESVLVRMVMDSNASTQRKGMPNGRPTSWYKDPIQI